jgi:uncharacterized phage protein (TIGR02218 family)
MGSVTLFRGFIGEITLRDGRFHAELRSLTHLLKQNIGELTSPTCRVRRLGDAQCKLPVDGFRVARIVADIASATRIVFAGETHASGYFEYGLITFTTGANAGVTREIKSHAFVSGSAQIDLRLAFALPVSVGDEAVLEAGCDRRFSTCRDKFANGVNFRGEPLLPGNDQVLRVARPPTS